MITSLCCTKFDAAGSGRPSKFSLDPRLRGRDQDFGRSGLMRAACDKRHTARSHLAARLLTTLNATYKIDYLFDPCAARTIEAGSIAWIVVFAVVRSETVTLGRRRSMSQIYMKPTLDEEQIVVMNDAHRPPGRVPILVLECPKSCMQFCGCRARNLGSKDILVSKQ